MSYTHKKYRILEMPFNIIVFGCVISFFIARISYESSYNVLNGQFTFHFALMPSDIFKSGFHFTIFTAPFVTYGYWETFVYIFFIFLVAKNVERSIGTIKILRIFCESYLLFIIFSYTFFKNAHIYGLWFYIFNIMWFYLQSQQDRRWFKYGYTIFCVIFAILVLYGGKTEYWKLGHLCGMLCVYLDENLSVIFTSIISKYKLKRVQIQKNYVKNIEKQIDNILEKIYKFGYTSLSKGEKDILYKASRIYKDRLNKKD